jgi:hypothetical protein
MPAVALDDLIKSWLIDLRSRNLSPKTVSTYGGAAGRREDAQPERCRKDVAEITRDDLRDYFASHCRNPHARWRQRGLPGATAVLQVG